VLGNGLTRIKAKHDCRCVCLRFCWVTISEFRVSCNAHGATVWAVPKSPPAWHAGQAYEYDNDQSDCVSRRWRYRGTQSLLLLRNRSTRTAPVHLRKRLRSVGPGPGQLPSQIFLVRPPPCAPRNNGWWIDLWSDEKSVTRIPLRSPRKAAKSAARDCRRDHAELGFRRVRLGFRRVKPGPGRNQADKCPGLREAIASRRAERERVLVG
jgi:hypothetical protein